MSSNSPFTSLTIQDMVDTLIKNNLSLEDKIRWLDAAMSIFKRQGHNTQKGAQQMLSSYMDLKIEPQIKQYMDKTLNDLGRSETAKNERNYVSCCRAAIRGLIHQDPIIAKLCTFSKTSISELEDKYFEKNGVLKSIEELHEEEANQKEELERYEDELKQAMSGQSF